MRSKKLSKVLTAMGISAILSVPALAGSGPNNQTHDITIQADYDIALNMAPGQDVIFDFTSTGNDTVSVCGGNYPRASKDTLKAYFNGPLTAPQLFAPTTGETVEFTVDSTLDDWYVNLFVGPELFELGPPFNSNDRVLVCVEAVNPTRSPTPTVTSPTPVTNVTDLVTTSGILSKGSHTYRVHYLLQVNPEDSFDQPISYILTAYYTLGANIIMPMSLSR